MSGYWIFGLGFIIGGCLGLLIAALLGAAHEREDDIDRWERLQREMGERE